VGEFFVLPTDDLPLLLSEEAVYEKPFGIERTRRAGGERNADRNQWRGVC
jgi:hypothetical protein